MMLNPGEQYTITPETGHWFQTREDGAVIPEFSTKSTDKRIIREPQIED